MSLEYPGGEGELYHLRPQLIRGGIFRWSGAVFVMMKGNTLLWYRTTNCLLKVTALLSIQITLNRAKDHYVNCAILPIMIIHTRKDHGKARS